MRKSLFLDEAFQMLSDVDYARFMLSLRKYYNVERVKVDTNNCYDIMGMCGYYDRLYRYHWLCNECRFLNFYYIDESLKSYTGLEQKETQVKCICCGTESKIQYISGLRIHTAKLSDNLNTSKYVDKPTYMHLCEEVIRFRPISKFSEDICNRYNRLSGVINSYYRTELSNLKEASRVTKPLRSTYVARHMFKDKISISCLSLGGFEILKEYLVKILKKLNKPYDMTKLFDLELYNPLALTGKSIVVIIIFSNNKYKIDYNLLDYDALNKTEYYTLYDFIYEKDNIVLYHLSRLSGDDSSQDEIKPFI